MKKEIFKILLQDKTKKEIKYETILECKYDIIDYLYIKISYSKIDNYDEDDYEENDDE